MRQRLTTMNVSLPVSLRDFVRRRMKERGFANASEYIRHLIRRDQAGPAAAKLEQLLQEGLDSGEPMEVTPKFWAAMERRVRERVAQTKRRRRKAG